MTPTTLCYLAGVPRYAIAAIAAAAFPFVWLAARTLTALISNAIAKSREDFPAQPTEIGHWPILLAAVSATAVAYIIVRKR